MDYLPFWLGGIALAGVALWMWILEGRTLGVTGQVTRIVDAFADPDGEAEAVEFSKRDPNDVLAALAAATAAELGVDLDAPKHDDSAGSRLDMQRHVPLPSRILFLLFIVLGSLTGGLLDGSFEGVRTSLAEGHAAFIGTGWQSWLLLLGGGVAVGFGTRMSGGCTSGHGLSGCSRIVPRSIVATMTFLGTAVLFTLVTKALM
ncbi:hypothetical protein PPSIR1_05593 [Plesiocystis pacifica SIR-1]|uniref:Uncharacterized protein n=1 Tax=Plesiocystis pacifica SIR-1 TaxID=391625 RepID=A6FX91_9BACT|nr:YeeE/YedE thiosulfate transporter family protein [Plesiocystis pacifica]EDM81915.1 hypothetical protein PPSIR1_05593 [Plesiocystis pacifica SIR-1]